MTVHGALHSVSAVSFGGCWFGHIRSTWARTASLGPSTDSATKIYAKAKTPAKWRAQEWHLLNADGAPSQPAQIRMQGWHGTGAGDQHISSSTGSSVAAHTFRDPAFEIEELEQKGRLRTPGARTRAVWS